LALSARAASLYLLGFINVGLTSRVIWYGEKRDKKSPQMGAFDYQSGVDSVDSDALINDVGETTLYSIRVIGGYGKVVVAGRQCIHSVLGEAVVIQVNQH
jgi:hypothetical protein